MVVEKVVEAIDIKRTMTEQHPTGLPHRLDMRNSVVEDSGAGNRVPCRQIRLAPGQQPTTTDRVAVKSETAKTLPQQYQPPRRVGMAQKSPGRTMQLTSARTGSQDVATLDKASDAPP